MCHSEMALATAHRHTADTPRHKRRIEREFEIPLEIDLFAASHTLPGRAGPSLRLLLDNLALKGLVKVAAELLRRPAQQLHVLLDRRVGGL